MTTTFHSVNTCVSVPHGTSEELAPLTPRSSAAPNSHLHIMNRDDATTPTRANFGALASQRPLPTCQPLPATANPPTTDAPISDLNRGNSQYSAKSGQSDDMDMDSEEGDDGSDGEASLNPDGTRSKKKTKAQRFFCTDYPPCNLSFTRSEHLARHIRKHTGERPFQCHCSRRFSRLDNLRQHAQTVHQNEDIPPESLAASGTRFQRQVRTDRVRPPGIRNRPATAGGLSGPVRNHHRNSLSASSIGSVNSIYSQRDDPRRRPPPLVMAGGDPRARYSQEVYRAESPNSQYPYRTQSPGFSTPTSATFSTEQNSPRWGSGVQSPAMGHSRTQSLYNEHRAPGRRLSVPNSGNSFQSPHGHPYPPPAYIQMNTSNLGAFSPSGSTLGSPTTSTTGSAWSPRRESLSQVADDAWRRRTWHPDTYSQFSSSFTSRLQQVTTPNNYTLYSSVSLPQPPIVPSNAPPSPQPTRLPGIESFGLLRRPCSPVRRRPSPMMVDSPHRTIVVPPDSYQHERPVGQHWDQGINRTMIRLDIQEQPDADAANSWAAEINRAIQSRGEHARAQPTVRFEDSTYSARPQTSGGIYSQPHASAPPLTPTKAKRMGWYHGPMSTVAPVPIVPYQQPLQRTSPVESSGSEGGIPGTPSNSTVSEINPGIVHSNGCIENRSTVVPSQHDPRIHNTYQYSQSHAPEAIYTYAPAVQLPNQHQQPPKPSNNSRLDALVAVATTQDKVTTAY